MNGSRTERFSLTLLFLIFVWFTWRGVTLFFSGDDMMNLYGAWVLDPWRLTTAQVLFWMPVYRPLGALVYRVSYALFGFHPEPLYVFCWLLLAGNVLLAYRFFRVFAASVPEALTALSLTLVHGSFQDLYVSAGTIYDRFCFFFTVLTLALYPRLRARGSRGPFLLICSLCILCMQSKESGIALPVLLFLYEGIFVFPEVWRSGAWKSWLLARAPLFLALAAISAIFVARVNRTPELVMPAYRPHPGILLWLTHIGGYLGILTYGHVIFTAAGSALLLAAMLAVAIALRNRTMLFGLALFLVTLTPVALLSGRPGYVLYVPDLGLGLFFAALLATVVRRLPMRAPRAEYAAFYLVTAALTLVHQRHWPPPYQRNFTPEFRLTQQFREEYPEMPLHSKLLFVTDDFPSSAWDLTYNLRLLYHDRTLMVHRPGGPPEQRPDPTHPVDYDHVFIGEADRYAELDPRHVTESVRLHILRNYTVGREMDFTHRDADAYLVSGVMPGDLTHRTRWTTPRATLKFDLYPAPAIFTAKFWVPEFVARPARRTLSVLVNGTEVGSLPLTREGMTEICFPAPARLITARGFTVVDLNVDKPYKDAAGNQFGVVLLRAGFGWPPS